MKKALKNLNEKKYIEMNQNYVSGYNSLPNKKNYKEFSSTNKKIINFSDILLLRNL